MTGDVSNPEVHTNAGSTETTPTSNFRGQVVESCEGYIRQFKRGEIDRVDVVRCNAITL